MGQLPAAYLDQFDDPAGYLDYASTSPVSGLVAERVAAAAVSQVAEGSLVPGALERYAEGVAAAARLTGRAPEAVTLVSSTTAGLFQVAFGLTGGNVVVPAHEFPANIYPWLRAAERGGPELRLVDVPDFRVTPEALAPAVDAGTVAIAVSLVDFRTGFRADVAALRELSREALVVVDAIQGLGAVSFDTTACDVIVAAGHKWIRAGFNAGMLAVSERTLMRLAPALTGWTGVADPFETEDPPPHEPLPTAERFQMGTPPFLGATAVTASIEVVEMAGVAEIEGAILERAGSVEAVLRSAGAEVLAPWQSERERAGIVSFRMSYEDAAVTAGRLRAAGLVFSDRGGWIRLAAHATTGPDTVAMLAAAL